MLPVMPCVVTCGERNNVSLCLGMPIVSVMGNLEQIESSVARITHLRMECFVGLFTMSILLMLVVGSQG